MADIPNFLKDILEGKTVQSEADKCLETIRKIREQIEKKEK